MNDDLLSSLRHFCSCTSMINGVFFCFHAFICVSFEKSIGNYECVGALSNTMTMTEIKIYELVVSITFDAL